MNKKNVLIIAYHFPPTASSGTFRTLKFVKYLPQFGWNPIVLTVDSKHEPLEPMDLALLQKVPEGVRVIRTYAWLPLKLLRGNLVPGRQQSPRLMVMEKEIASLVLLR